MLAFDIGSNVGKWALANSNRFKNIITLEASPSTYNQLVNDCKSPNIRHLNYAVCNNNGNDIDFFQSDANTISTINEDWLNNEKSRFYKHANYTKITCKTITIDSLIDTYGVPDLIKIDVEGGEYGCVSSLNQKINMLCFEWASEVNDITFKCLDHLYALGFRDFYLQFEDNYVFRPNEYYGIEVLKSKLHNTTPKEEWGMVWCK